MAPTTTFRRCHVPIVVQLLSRATRPSLCGPPHWTTEQATSERTSHESAVGVAHPGQSSLNGWLPGEGVRATEELGHTSRVSDLYAMKWEAVVDRDDYPDETRSRLIVTRATLHAYDDGRLASNIRAEQEKLDWADVVVFRFPLWWYGMPAILKGLVVRPGLRQGVGGSTGPASRDTPTASTIPSTRAAYCATQRGGSPEMTLLTSGSRGRSGTAGHQWPAGPDSVPLAPRQVVVRRDDRAPTGVHLRRRPPQ